MLEVRDNAWSTGRSWAAIERELDGARRDDTPWSSPRNLSASYFAGDDVFFVAREAFLKHIGDNVTHRFGLHPSVQRYEREVVDFVRLLLNAPGDARGTVTTGGSESLFLAMRAARDWARENRPGITAPEILLTHTTYPVFNKAAHALGLAVRQVPTSVHYRADVAALKAAVNANTIMMVGGAPPFPYGCVDPLSAMAAIAEEHDIWLHADACIGGFVLPFAEALGRPVPMFDFRLPAVRSMSIDCHKYGYALRGCSVLLLRDRTLGAFQDFRSAAWPAGDYISDTLSGSRNAGPVASAWAVMNYLGFKGYRQRMAETFAATDRLTAAIQALPGFQIHGQPEGVHFSFGSDRFDMEAIGDGMMARGWMMNLQSEPRSLLLMLSSQHDAAVVDSFAVDLGEVADNVAAGRQVLADNRKAYRIY